MDRQRNGDSVTEVNTSDGSLAGVLSGPSYGFNSPARIAFDGTDMWVTNSGGTSVTKVNAATGSAVRVLSGSNYAFAKPFGIAFDGRGHVWITNNSGGSVTKVNTADGSLVRVFNGLVEFIGPAGIAFDGQHLWIADNGVSGLVTEINATDGSLVRDVITGGNAQDVASDGVDVWVTSFQGTVTEIGAGTGAVVNTLSPAAYGFKDSAGIAFAGHHLWIADNQANTLTAVQGP